MTIWWCEVHENAGPSEGLCWAALSPNFGPEDGPCRLVERVLVSSDALVIERDVDGNWPTWAVETGLGYAAVDKLFRAKALVGETP